MITVTSAVANKLLKQYNEQLTKLYQDESACALYTEIEGVEPIVPEYNFGAVRAKVETLTEKIMTIKHSINEFNVKTKLSKSGMTIDKALVFMSILTKEKARLEGMIVPVKKKLKSGFGVRNNQIEYDVINYDVDEVRKNYDNICKRLTDLQVELDVVNSTETFKIPIEED